MPAHADEIMTSSEWGRLRSFLAKQGLSNAQISAVIGANVNGRRRKEIAQSLMNWLKNRPKKNG